MGMHIHNPYGPAQELNGVTVVDGQRLKWDAL